MLSIPGRTGKTCDGYSRRELLRVGGASLIGGKGSALSAMLGALLIVMIRQAIRTLHLDQNYEWIIIGGALIVAVVLDQSGSRLLARRLAAGTATANRPARAA